MTRRTRSATPLRLLGLAVVALALGAQGPAVVPVTERDVPPGVPPASRPLETVGILPPGQVGVPYVVRIIGGGTGPYRLTAGQWPPGLAFLPDGRLVGRPISAGVFDVRLAVRDAALLAADGRWRVRIGDQPAARRTVVPPVPHHRPEPVAPPAAPRDPPVADGTIVVYRLDRADFATKLDPRPIVRRDVGPVAVASVAAAPTGVRPAVPAPAAAPATIPRPLVVQIPAPPTPAAPGVPATPAAVNLTINLPPAAPPPAVAPVPAVPVPPEAAAVPTIGDATAAIERPPPVAKPTIPAALAALAGTEYPDRALFASAVRYTLADYAVTEAQIDAVAAVAAKPVAFGAAPLPQWAAVGGCACVGPRNTRRGLVYGILPFWRSPAPIDFSLFDRIGVLGVQLQRDGFWRRPGPPVDAPWWAAMSRSARTAHDHGTRLDLVLQRADWRFLATVDGAALDSLAERAAANAVAVIDTPSTGGGRWYDALLPGGWRPSSRLFDGATVFFTQPAVDDPVRARFERFFARFAASLVTGLQRAPRDLALAIVIPDAPFCLAGEGSRPCRAGAFDQQRLQRLADLAAPPPAAGVRPIDFHLLVTVAEFAGARKKQLRATIDSFESGGFEGTGRMRLLASVVPLSFRPAGPPPAGDAFAFGRARLVKDLAYYHGNFGGAGFWPVPSAGAGDGDATVAAIRAALAPPAAATSAGPWSALIDGTKWCSPALRLAVEASVVLTVIGIVVCATSNAPAARRRLYLFATLGLAALAVILVAVAIDVDPALDGLRHSSVLVAAVVVAIGAGVALALLRNRVRPP